MKFLKKLHENSKLQFAVVVSMATLFLMIGWRMEVVKLAAELPLEASAIAEIKTEANKVKSARDNYLQVIGKGNRGAYDEYQDSLLCKENLDLKAAEMKNLRASYQRLMGEIELREREQRVKKAIVDFEKEAEKIMDEVLSKEELETIKEREAKARSDFEQAGESLKNCLQTFKNLKKCEFATQTLLKAKESYLREVYEIENIAKEKENEVNGKIDKLIEKSKQRWYEKEKDNIEKIKRVSKLEIQAEKLKAWSLGDLFTTKQDSGSVSSTAAGKGIDNGKTAGQKVGEGTETLISPITSGIGMISGFGGTILKTAGNIVGGGLSTISGLTGGAMEGINSVFGGISDIAKSLGLENPLDENGGTADGRIFNGPGAVVGLNAFKKSYAGNTYGSAIGMITGWTNFLLPFVGTIAISAIVYAGFLYLTAASNEEQSGKAKKIIIWVVIGIVIIFSAYAIVNTLLGSSEEGGGGGTSVNVNVGGINVDYKN